MPALISASTVFTEHVCRAALPTQRALNQLCESAGGELPTAIYPDIRILTADRATANYTLYPKASLIGKPSRGTGLISFVKPYAVPFIQDHNAGGGMCDSPSSPVYGRFYKPAKFETGLGEGFLRGIPTITHPEAIENILTGRWLTVSLGSRADGVKCSICGMELTQQHCDHERGKRYEVEVEGKKKPEMQTALWLIGEIRAKELSAVISPADETAGILTTDTMQESARREGPGALLRMLARTSRGVFDLSRGIPLSESEAPAWLRPVPQRANFHFFG